jgi:hypothetical protein
MKTMVLLCTMVAVFSTAWGSASSALARHDCDRSARAMRRQQEEMLEDERDRQIDALRDSTEAQEDAMRCWYKAQKAAFDAEYDQARRCLDGCAWRQFARDHDDREDAVRRNYWDQRRALRRGRLAAESQIRDHYRQLERAVERGVVSVYPTHSTAPVMAGPSLVVPKLAPAPVPTLAPPRAPMGAPERVPTPAPMPTLAPPAAR